MSSASIACNRFGLGLRPDEAPPANPQRWLLDQLERYQALPAPWAGQPRTPALLQAYVAQERAVREAAENQKLATRQAFRRAARDDYVAAVGTRAGAALQTPTPFAERLVHFWANHFAVSVDKLAVVGLAGGFEADAIRPHVLGRFEDMLLAVARHPAMLLYLDQANSIGPDSPAGRRAAERNPGNRRGLNENLAREILELHTLGVRSGYTQADVTEFARALTGWSIAGDFGPRASVRAEPASVRAEPVEALPQAQGERGPDEPRAAFEFRRLIHEPGARTVLGRGYPQSGEAQAAAILHDLAQSPATARHIATKLARHFIADEPPAAVVQRLADVFLRSGGDLPAVYRALVDSPEAWQATAPKFKSPWDWAVSSLRGVGRRDVPAMQMTALMDQLGQPVWRPGSPAGYDDIAATWAAPDALVRRVDVAQRMASQAGDMLDARALAPRLLPGALGAATASAIARAESPGSALALLLVSPEFLRR